MSLKEYINHKIIDIDIEKTILLDFEEKNDLSDNNATALSYIRGLVDAYQDCIRLLNENDINTIKEG